MRLHDKTSLIVGPPGTGKTTRLLEMVESRLESGCDPDKVGFLGFTKKAAEEAKSRAMTKFGLSDRDLPFFRTLHSLAFRQCGVERSQMMSWSNWRELGEWLGLDFKGHKVVDDSAVWGMNNADRLAFLENLARTKMQDLRTIWNTADEIGVNWLELERFATALEKYKTSREVWDFTDLILKFITRKYPIPRLDTLIIDEAQDLSRSQWKMVQLLAENAKELIVGGDDDQAIFAWSGADVETFLGLEGDVTTLNHSYRIPGLVHSLAQKISAGIGQRRQKEWSPRTELGSVTWHNNPEDVDLSSGEWLLLTRHGYQMDELENLCMENGFSFDSVGRSPLKSKSLTALVAWESLRKGVSVPAKQFAAMTKLCGWLPQTAKEAAAKITEGNVDVGTAKALGISFAHPWFTALDKIGTSERDFFIAALRRKETLLKQPRIRISTIHSIKGGEADNVLVLTDLSARTFQEMEKNPDDEMRVFYVAVTRTRHNLHLIQPRTRLHFQIGDH